MADKKQAEKYDYMKPENRKEIFEPAGQNDNNFGICAIAVQEVVQEKNKKPKTQVTSVVKRDSILSTDLVEGMVIKAESSKNIAKDADKEVKHSDR